MWGGRDECYDNVPTIKSLTAQTGNINMTSTLSQNLQLQKGDTGDQEVFHKALFGNTGSGRDEEEEKEGNAEEHIDGEEQDLDEVMKEEDEEETDASDGSSSLNCCQSPDPIMTDCAYSETGTEHTQLNMLLFFVLFLSATCKHPLISEMCISGICWFRR